MQDSGPQQLFKCCFALLFCGIVLLLCSCRSVVPEAKFERLFCWGVPASELAASKYAAAGVTDIIVKNQKQYRWALKYGMTPYWHVFLPEGPHKQVMTPEEQKHFEYISGKDLDKKLSRAERMKILHQRRREKQDLYGGDVKTEIATLNNYQIACFSCDKDLTLTRKKLDSLLERAPDGVAGIHLDFVGYMNHNGCYCKGCLDRYSKYLKAQDLADTPENKAVFYRDEMVSYYNAVIDYIKSRRKDYKVVVHVHPMFRSEPLYGNRTKADYCGQTVSWYFPWSQEKIRSYTRFVVDHAKDYHPHVQGIPFIGLSTDKSSSLGFKTPEQVDLELRTILEAGGRKVMVCNGSSILQDGYFEVFKKYCGKKK